jgi:hypothetical protein
MFGPGVSSITRQVSTNASNVSKVTMLSLTRPRPATDRISFCQTGAVWEFIGG